MASSKEGDFFPERARASRKTADFVRRDVAARALSLENSVWESLTVIVGIIGEGITFCSKCNTAPRPSYGLSVISVDRLVVLLSRSGPEWPTSGLYALRLLLGERQLGEAGSGPGGTTASAARDSCRSRR